MYHPRAFPTLSIGTEGFCKVMKNNSSKFMLLMFCVVSALLLISCAKAELTTNRADSSGLAGGVTGPHNDDRQHR